MKKLLILFLILFSACFSFKLPEGKYELNEQGIDYYIYVPPKVSNKMILILHDSNEKSKQAVDYWYEYARKANYLILAPDPLKKEGWGKDDEERIKRLIGIISRDYGDQRVLINGVSSSSFYAFYLVMNNPGRFDALCNFMGLVMSSLSPEILVFPEGQKTSPILFVHGMMKNEIPTKYARLDVQKIREKGYDITYWEVNNLKGQVNRDILKWFEEIISQ
ncbi:MAG: hypothetical protein WCH76_00460 [Candidatus Riflemargulisbacteria bacterium]